MWKLSDLKGPLLFIAIYGSLFWGLPAGCNYLFPASEDESSIERISPQEYNNIQTLDDYDAERELRIEQNWEEYQDGWRDGWEEAGEEIQGLLDEAGYDIDVWDVVPAPDEDNDADNRYSGEDVSYDRGWNNGMDEAYKVFSSEIHGHYDIDIDEL